ncbi:MAG: site-2 protease family protein [Clostridia bacterium]|nr:site-2 protease family protein [Clostridia bacterium]
MSMTLFNGILMPEIVTNILYVIVAIFIFGLLIIIHELGHYTAARLLGVKVLEFSIGMGPALVSYTSKKTEIKYSLRLLPIGGYVKMLGEDEENDDPAALNKAKPWKRLIILSSGALMNILTGVIAMFILVATPNFLVGGTTVAEFQEGYVQQQSEEILLGDKIVKVGNARVKYYQELAYEIMHQCCEPTDVTVVRNGETLTLHNVVFPTVEDQGVVFGEMFFKVSAIEKTFGNVVSYSLHASFSTIKMIWQSLFDLITGRYGLSAVSGPVGVTKAVAESAKLGISNLVYISIFITMNLGIFNLLPLPALDGSRIVFVLIEMVRGKPINPKYEGYVHLAGIIVLLILMVVITFKDIISLFA